LQAFCEPFEEVSGGKPPMSDVHQGVKIPKEAWVNIFREKWGPRKRIIL
jgi:hypothetical protein